MKRAAGSRNMVEPASAGPGQGAPGRPALPAAAAPSSFHLGYRPGLDGLRAFAILLVLATHGGVLSDGFGFIGVNTFFVLSGFLITSLLMLEWQESGRINLYCFYLRRALRLLPALVAMLVAFTVYALLTMAGKQLADSLREVFYALFYFMNWAKVFQLGPTLQLAHTWSLSLEEQFYFCWPWLLLLLLKKSSRTSLLCWVALGIGLTLALRTFLFVGDLNLLYDPDRLTAALDTRADALLVGCLVGAAAASGRLAGWRIHPLLLSCLSVLAGIGLLWLGRYRPMSAWMVYAGWLAASVFAAVIILRLITGSGTVVHRVLEWPVLVYIGKLSYSLYIWHYAIAQVIARYNGSASRCHLLYWISIVPAALASYYLIERPCLRLKRQFQRAESDSSAPLASAPGAAAFRRPMSA